MARTKIVVRSDLVRSEAGQNKLANTRLKAKLDNIDDCLDVLLPYTAASAGTKSRAYVYAVRAVITSNVADLTSVSTTQDGLTLVAGDRLALVAQSTGAQNGIYVVGTVAAGSAPWTRAVDFATGAVIPNGSIIVVDAGTAGANRIYKLTNAGTITAGTTALTFDVVSSSNSTIKAATTLSGAGAIAITAPTCLFTSTGDAQALTVADGTLAGRRLRIVHIVDGGSGVITQTTGAKLTAGISTITFTNVYDWVELEWSGSLWNVIGYSGVTIA